MREPDSVEFFVRGKPVVWRPARILRNGHKYTQSHVKIWQRMIARQARLAMAGRAILTGPVVLHLSFVKRHTKRNKKERWWIGSEDLTNLVKNAEDALNGIVYDDDRYVIGCSHIKIRGDVAGVLIRVEQVHEP